VIGLFGIINTPKKYLLLGRMAAVLIATAAFFLLSFYATAGTEHNVFPVLFPAVAVSSWVAGRLGGFFSTIALSLGTAYYHLPPEGSFSIADAADAIRLGTFTLSGAFVAWLSGALKDKGLWRPL
jgi:K+-sensing histidine kinase KdpD